MNLNEQDPKQNEKKGQWCEYAGIGEIGFPGYEVVK